MIFCWDIGGTAVKFGLCDRQGTLYAKDEKSVSSDHYETPLLDKVLREARVFLGAFSDISIEGIGISATGQIDTRTGTVIGTNGKIPGWEGSCLKQSAEEVFGVPAFAINDANAAVLGECFAGRAKGRKNVVMVTLGTGVGGGLVLDGRPYGGAKGIAGELGHFTLYADGPECTCGKRGCYENYASTTALIRKCREVTGNILTGREIFERAREGDTRLLQAIDGWISDIAHGLTGLVHIFNPEMVLIGGGVSAQEELLMAPLRDRVLHTVMPRFAEGLEIERAILGNDAGMIGAAKWFMEKEKE